MATTVRARSASETKRSAISTRCLRSRCTVGSSNANIGVSCARPSAIAISCFSPALRVRTSRAARCDAPTRSSAAAARSRSCTVGPLGPRPCGRRPSATSSSARVANGSTRSAPTTAMERAMVARLKPLSGSVQRITSPEATGRVPLSARRSDVFPAPLAPTMATRSPTPIFRLISSRISFPPISTRTLRAPISS